MNTSSTPYDDSFRTLVQKGGELRVPFINEMFRLDDPVTYDDKIISLANEDIIEEADGRRQKIITDSALRIRNRTFHMECESASDGTILVRMFEYDVNMGLKDHEFEDNHLTVKIPYSGVLFLRKQSDTIRPMTVTIEARGRSIEYPVEAIYLRDYTIDDLIEKDLLFLVPFYMFNLEQEFARAERNEETAKKNVTDALTKLLDYVNHMHEGGRITADKYLLVTYLLKNVTDALTRKYQNMRKELDDIMGGKVLEYPGEKLYNDGVSKGRKEGRMEGGNKRAQKIAANMIRADKLSDQEIADYSGLTLDEVLKLREEVTQTA